MVTSYSELVVALAADIAKQASTPTEYFDYSTMQSLTPLLTAAIQLRVSKISDRERNDYWALFKETGIYGNLGLDIEQRLALFLVSLDVQYEVAPDLCLKFCKPISIDSPIIVNDKSLARNIRDELLCVDGSRIDSTGQLLTFKDSICRTSAILNKHFELYKYLFKISERSKTFIKVDCDDISQSKNVLLLEEVIRPIDPKFIENLDLARGEKRFGIYELQRTNHFNDQRFWDYTHGYGRLEVVFKKNADTISCMLEEIPREPSGRVLRGLCLHATCSAPRGTSFLDATADHIDGAVNYYFDENALARFDSTIETAECDASCRTHLFRVNDVNFSLVIQIAMFFFGSSALVFDWLGDQFMCKH